MLHYQPFNFKLYQYLNIYISDNTISEIVSTYPKNLGTETVLIDGALELVAYLHGKYGIYIITNGLYDVQSARLDASELKNYISDVFISEKVGAEKPSVKFFDYVIKTVGDNDKSSYLVIGDSLSSDIDGAIAAGIDCVLFDTSKSGTQGRSVTNVITKLDELKNFI